MHPFAEDQPFRTGFVEKLRHILDAPQLGAFILVLANSLQDRNLYRALFSDLTSRFDELVRDTPQAPPDDLDVFNRLKQRGLDEFSIWEHRTTGPWDLVYNPLRALRPPRSAGAGKVDMRQAFNPDGFHFNKPFLRSEILWEGEWHDSPLRVLYNKFPFSPYHLIIAPGPEQQQPQNLTEAAHAMACRLPQQNGIPGFGLAYNSLGAYASINHLHFHGYIRETPFPMEHPEWRHNGGDRPYPVNCMKFMTDEAAWDAARKLQDAGQPFNILYRRNGIYLLPRRPQGTAAYPSWCLNPAWHELGGVFTLADKGVFDTLDAPAVDATMRQLVVS